MPEFTFFNTTLGRGRRLPVLRYTGLSLPDKDHLSARGPRQHGATYVATFFRPREFTLEWWLRGCDAEEYEFRHRDLVQVLKPTDDGELRIVGAVDDRYILTCRLATALEVRRVAPYAAEVLGQFIADDPYFTTAQQVAAFDTTNAGGLAIPFTIPATITGAGNHEDVLAVNNTGHEDAYPQIFATTPAYSPQFRNNTTGLALTVNQAFGGSSNEQLQIDMGARTVDLVNLSTGVRTSMLAYVTGDFWALVPGSNTIRITTEDPAAMQGSISWMPRFLAVV